MGKSTFQVSNSRHSREACATHVFGVGDVDHQPAQLLTSPAQAAWQLGMVPPTQAGP